MIAVSFLIGWWRVWRCVRVAVKNCCFPVLRPTYFHFAYCQSYRHMECVLYCFCSHLRSSSHLQSKKYYKKCQFRKYFCPLLRTTVLLCIKSVPPKQPLRSQLRLGLGGLGQGPGRLSLLCSHLASAQVWRFMRYAMLDVRSLPGSPAILSGSAWLCLYVPVSASMISFTHLHLLFLDGSLLLAKLLQVLPLGIFHFFQQLQRYRFLVRQVRRFSCVRLVALNLMASCSNNKNMIAN